MVHISSFLGKLGTSEGWGFQCDIRVERLPEKHIKQRFIDCSKGQAGKDSFDLLWNGFLGMEAGCRVRRMVGNLLKLWKLAECSSERRYLPLIVKQGEREDVWTSCLFIYFCSVFACHFAFSLFNQFWGNRLKGKHVGSTTTKAVVFSVGKRHWTRPCATHVALMFG